MGVQIIEQFICSKYPDQKKCEDGLFISNDFIAVIDGVTSKGRAYLAGWVRRRIRFSFSP